MTDNKRLSADSYRVCLIVPENNPHTVCFNEIGLLLSGTLNGMGFDCDSEINRLDPRRINIILGYHLLTYESGLKNYRYIPYQLEQLHSLQSPFSENMERVLRDAYDVWDYSDKNIEFLKTKGIKAQRLVPGFHPCVQLIKPAANTSVDVLFYGSVGDRRKKVLEGLAAQCKVKALFGVYGEKRDKWISRSRILLNMHHYSRQIFESVRVSYLLNNGCMVVSETSVDYPYPEVDLCLAPYDQLVDTCLRLLGQPEECERIKKKNHEQFKTHYSMRQALERILKEG